MDWRLLEFYLTRVRWAWLLWFACGVLQSEATRDIALSGGFALFAVFMVRPAVQRSALRALWTLPISCRAKAATAWAALVGFPLVMVFFGLLFGGSVLGIRPPSLSSSVPPPMFWALLHILSLNAFLLSCAFLLEPNVVRPATRGWRLLGQIVFWFVVFVFAMGWVSSAWGTHVFVRNLTLLAALPMLLLSYLFGTRAVKKVEVSQLPHAPRARRWWRARDYGTMSWHAIALSNPLSAAFVRALYLVLACGLILAALPIVFGESPRASLLLMVGGESLLPLILLPLFAVSLPWISSMRAFGSLPISRRNLVLAVIALPAVASLPLVPFAGPLASLSASEGTLAWGRFFANYVLLLGTATLVNVLCLRAIGRRRLPDWESCLAPIGCVLLLFFYAVFLLLLTLWAIIMIGRIVEVIFGHWTVIALTVGSALILVSLLWTYRLLAFGSDAYRARQLLSLFTLGEEE